MNNLFETEKAFGFQGEGIFGGDQTCPGHLELQWPWNKVCPGPDAIFLHWCISEWKDCCSGFPTDTQMM
jgi:hypothetical protein